MTAPSQNTSRNTEDPLEILRRILDESDANPSSPKVTSTESSLNEDARVEKETPPVLDDLEKEISTLDLEQPLGGMPSVNQTDDDDEDERKAVPFRKISIFHKDEDDDVGEKKLVLDQILSREKPVEIAKTKKKSKLGKWVLGIFLSLFVIIGVFGALGFYFYQHAQGMIAIVREIEVSARGSYAEIKAQNLVEAKKHLLSADEKMKELHRAYSALSWTGKIPFAGSYYQDGEHTMNAGQTAIEVGELALQAIEPYADVLGFAGEGTFTGGSVENRIQLALTTLDKVMPVMDQISTKLDTINTELSMIDENRYPESVRGISIRSKITKAKQLSAQASVAIKEGRPVLEVLPSVGGADGKRKRYLVIFQNDKELRATGGFMTAYAFIFVENGVVTQEKSDDIYELDKKFAKKPAIPEILKVGLTTEKKWNLRDMNIDPDFKKSMDTFWEHFQDVPGEPHEIDGIIAMDTHVLENLVEVLGPIQVPGYGTFTAEKDKRCDCAQIIYALSEIVDRPTPYIREDRKGIIGPMMQAIISKAYDAPKSQWPTLFQSAWANVQGKHVQFYFFDEKTQKAAETVGAAGRLKAPVAGEDYLMLVDVNLGGAKSNMFVKQSVKHTVSAPQNGMVKKTVELTYKNAFPASNCNLEAGQLCLNGELTDWFRAYVPKGSVLDESLGFNTDSVKTYEEGDHMVIEGVFRVVPMGQTKITLSYQVPYTATEYRLFMQKQGGTDDVTHLFDVEGGETELKLDMDKSVVIPF
ncbi:MAG: hypothetical protein UX04_C0001G0114 [Microgenomates group bacterium GW2011_GWF2_45_18]|nr:MAG: hypothetical protein UW18_C0003G0116 [Microgenomates group bacterium GW2011_GWF1_44_10]KKU02343.1 MAG: hypothetical protein UX04_C0001G0114 [Microgenomates group bacterium GW2011_GWF2_45_18]HAU99190.1 hypothetical protein [Candidatus Paceibacterota bacterium]HAX01720.1 hypothetical protein [Candidatus Paceibacterota bacterium]